MAELGRDHAGLPDDLLNFHCDPVACAVALGWPGAVVEEMRLLPVLDGQLLRFQPDQQGWPTRVATGLDGVSFTATWLSAVEAAQRAAGLEVAGTGGCFMTTGPEVGFQLHAATIAAARERAVRAGVATGQQVDELVDSLRAAAGGEYGWVSTPFFLDLTLRKPLTA